MGRNSTLVGLAAAFVVAVGVLGLVRTYASEAAASDRVPVLRSDDGNTSTDGYEPRQIGQDGAARSSCFIGANVVATEATQQDCDALINLHIAVNGPGWTDDTGWLTPLSTRSPGRSRLSLAISPTCAPSC